MTKNSTSFKKGQTGNPKGRPRKGETAMDDLNRAIKKVEKEKRKDIYEHFLERAFENDAVLLALLKKKLPDLKQTELNANVDASLKLKKLPDSLAEMIKRDKS